jgi:hypothetical protein
MYFHGFGSFCLGTLPGEREQGAPVDTFRARCPALASLSSRAGVFAVRLLFPKIRDRAGRAKRLSLRAV